MNKVITLTIVLILSMFSCSSSKKGDLNEYSVPKQEIKKEQLDYGINPVNFPLWDIITSSKKMVTYNDKLYTIIYATLQNPNKNHGIKTVTIIAEEKYPIPKILEYQFILNSVPHQFIFIDGNYSEVTITPKKKKLIKKNTKL